MHVPALNWPEVREGKTAWAKAVRKKMGPGPSTSFFTLGRRFTALRNDPDHAWLKDYPYQVVRVHLLRGDRGAGEAACPGRRAGSGPQRGAGHGQRGHRVRDARHGPTGCADRPQAGLGAQVEPRPTRERAVKQAAPQGGGASAITPRTKPAASWRIRHTVVVEDLPTKAMTKSAKDTVEAPGKQVKQKSRLNRSILASGWGSLERKLAYKAGELLKVNPAYTSQTCSRCGHVHSNNRPSQAVFACRTCGFRANADPNAAVNILARAELPSVPVSARGTGADARRGAIPWGPQQPVNETGANLSVKLSW